MQIKETVRLVLTGGETGGHLYAAMAVAEALTETIPGSKAVYVGASGRIDMKKNIGQKFTTHSLSMAAYDRKNLFGNITLPWKFYNSVLKALHILYKYRPHVVMGVGAFPSVPVILAAWIRRVPILLFEPNAQPGMANSLLAKTAQRICVSKTGMEAFFPGEKIVITGTPVRAGLLRKASQRQRGYDLFGIPAGARIVLVTGGSTGSVTINNMVLKHLKYLARGVGHLIWQTGEKDEQRIRTSLNNDLPENCTILPYIDNMGYAYAVADLIVSSAGAVSLSELALLGKPAVIIPDPDVTENHQLKNAQELYKMDGCILFNKKISTRKKVATIVELVNNRSELGLLRHRIQPFAETRAAGLIVEQIIQAKGGFSG